MFMYYAQAYVEGRGFLYLRLPSDFYLNSKRRYSHYDWEKAYMRDLATITGNPDGENW